MSVTVDIEESKILPRCIIEYPFIQYEKINVMVENKNKGIDKVELSVFEAVSDQFSNNCLPASMIQAVLLAYTRVCLLSDPESVKYTAKLKYRLELFNTPQKVRWATFCLMKFAKLQLPDGETIIEIDKSVQKRLIDSYFPSDNENEALIEYHNELTHFAPGEAIQGFMDMYQAAIMCYYLFDCTLDLWTLNANYQEHDICSQKFLLNRPVHDLLGNLVDLSTKPQALLHGSSTIPDFSMNHFTFLLLESIKVFLPDKENNILIAGISISFYFKPDDDNPAPLLLSGLVTGVFDDRITISYMNSTIMTIGRYDYTKWIVTGTSLCPKLGNNYTLFDLFGYESSIPPYKYNSLSPSTPIYIDDNNRVAAYTTGLYLYRSFQEKIKNNQYKKMAISFTGHLIVAAGDIIDYLLVNKDRKFGYYVHKCDNRKHKIYLQRLVSNVTKIKPLVKNTRSPHWQQLVPVSEEILCLSMNDIISIRMSYEHFLYPSDLIRDYNMYIKRDDIVLAAGECPIEAYNLIMKDRLFTDVIRFVEETYIPLLTSRNNNQFYSNRFTQYEPSIRSAEPYPIRAWLIALNNKRTTASTNKLKRSIVEAKIVTATGLEINSIVTPSVLVKKLKTIPAVIPELSLNSYYNDLDIGNANEQTLLSAYYFYKNEIDETEIAISMKEIIANPC